MRIEIARFTQTLKAILIILILTVRILPAISQQVNIIFIYADDWGYGDLSLHGHPTITTPNLDRLAVEGTEFLQFNVCNPVCSPSRAAIMTGHYPSRHHIHQHFANHQSNMDRDMPDWLDPALPMLSRLFKEAGYRTSHYGKWHLTNSGVIDPPLPVTYGYDESYVFNGPGPQVGVPTGISTGKGVDNCMDFIHRDRSKPFFINLWIHESHAVIDPPQDAKDAYAHVDEPFRSYYACISYADRELGRLFQYLKDEQLDSTTLVVFSSDNGPENPSDDPERVTYYSRGETAGLRGQKRSLFEGGVGLPFIVHWPGTVPAGKKNNTTHIAAVDVLPSLCNIAGIDLPADYVSDGEDLSEGLLGSDQKRTKPVFWDWRGAGNLENWPRMAVRSGDWKFVSNGDGSQRHLFNIQASRVEEKDSLAYYPELADSLFLMVNKWREDIPKNIPVSKIRFYTNKGGDQVLIDFSAADASLAKVSDPEFRLYRSEKNTELPIDSISHDTRKIYLHLSPDLALLPGDQLSIAFRAGEVKAENGASLLFFSTEAVENRIQTGSELITLGFRVFDGSNDFRLPDVSLMVDSAEAQSNDNGEAYFKFPEGEYTYSAHRENFTWVEDSLILISDTLINLYLHPTLASVKFRIRDGTLPLSSARVEVGEYEKQTNAVGIALFEDLAIGEHYTYTVSKSGYDQADNSFILYSDTTIQLVLTPGTGTFTAAKTEVLIYPNPCNGRFCIQCPDEIQCMEIYSIQGKLLQKMESVESGQEINLSALGKGIYLLKTTPLKGSRTPHIARIQYL
ncbi:MAG: sulfatase-like hydrolase/transferase [Bacteroidetes bacterium]|nr:sulfatase-like hydrolase/transferase [Bacteroidota bacterium]